MENILKRLLLFNQFQANTSLLRSLTSGYIERKQGSKLINTFRKQSSLSYSLFVEFELNLIFDTSGEVIAAKDSLRTLFIRSRVFKGKRKVAIEPNC